MTRTFPDHVDVAIVGSGPTGSAYARVLSEQAPHLDIAMFEVGPRLADPPGVHVKNIPDEADRAAAQRASQGPGGADLEILTSPAAAAHGQRRPRAGTFLLPGGWRQPGQEGLPAAAMSSNVGGMGAHWTCACPRPGGAERIDVLPDLDALLGEAERLLGVTADALSGAPLADEVRARLSAEFDAERPVERRVQPMPLAVERHGDGSLTWSGSDVVLGEATRSNPRFTLLSDALVTRVVVEGEQGERHATGVVVRDLAADGDDREHAVAARVVVVAADALRTPQLLWASGVRPDALGRYLNDQPQILLAARLRDLPERTEEQTGDEDGAIVAHSGVSWVPYTDDLPFHGQVMQYDASPIPLADAGELEPGSIVGLGWFCAKELRPEDRVDFTDEETDGYGMPGMVVHYDYSDRDRQVIAAAKRAVRRAADALGTPLDDEPFELPPGSSLHYQGTTRMGATDDGTSVCSPTCEVWGVSGLYVAGNNVIPTSTACNPTPTSVALAVAGAHDIARRLS